MTDQGDVMSIFPRDQLESYKSLLSDTYRKLLDVTWIQPDTEGKYGLIVRLPDGSYISEPPSMDQRLLGIIRDLDIPVAVTLASETTSVVLQNLSTFQTYMWIESSRKKYPVLENAAYLTASEIDFKTASACLCRQENYILVWCNDLENLFQCVDIIESELVDVIQRIYSLPTGRSSAQFQSINTPLATPSLEDLPPAPQDRVREAMRRETAVPLYYWNDSESWLWPEPETFVPRSHQINVALAMVLVIAAQGGCIAQLVLEVRHDGQPHRLALLLLVPIFAGFSMFFMLNITGALFQIFGPSPPTKSLYYSGTAPDIPRADQITLPHITIQIPVYKESLGGVIIPTVKSLLRTIKKYEEHGGSASIYVNDDGMQCVDKKWQEVRRSFYAINNIGWCARPKHNDSEVGGYTRRGKFKKASNMNNAMDLSVRVDEEFGKLLTERGTDIDHMSQKLSASTQQELYRQAMRAVLLEDQSGNWAEGNIHIGDVILLVDSDTRVPGDCLLYAAIEMYNNPKLGIIQNSSGVLQVTEMGFENCMAYFTRTLYTAMEWAVASGDNAPFVGHNAFIRRQALDDISYYDEDGPKKWWSESHVSEDFDLSIRLNIRGYVVRLSTYHGSGFQEGVSLTIYDEINRWEKYMYGVNEIVFHSWQYILFRGPFTPMVYYFLRSNLRVTSKLSIMAYLFNYYAIASAFPLTIINYFLLGLVKDVDKFYVSSWKVFIGVLVVFNGLAPLGISMAKHRLGTNSYFLPAMIEAIKWTPLFALFFTGLSYHLCKAAVYHFFALDISWGATSKEIGAWGRGLGLSKIIWNFRNLYIVLVALIGAMIYFGLYAPAHLRITNVEAVGPLVVQVTCHFLLPLLHFIV